jgi:CubicO group peptidase (beta-lactamase class C family)
MSDLDIRGLCPPKFAQVADAFAANFREADELGARFTFTVEGEIVVDLIGGYADRARQTPFTEDTLSPIFSTTKAVAALMIARLVDAGSLDYEQTVASVWPQFAAAGKGEITVGQAMSHQAGLSGITEAIEPTLWFDWDAICAVIAAQAPIWPPGTQSGYHPVTVGYIAGEIFRRIDGRTMGKAVREDIAGPFGLDLWIGLPPGEHGRVAEIKKPRELPTFGEVTPALQAAFLTKWAAPGGKHAEEWRQAEIPSANGHATAEALARLMSALACDGELDGRHVLGPEARALASKERIVGQDLVLPAVVSWGAGFMRNEPNFIYGPGAETFGHSGRGGSCAFADPARRVSGAYVMNRESACLMGDPRPRRLIDAAYGCL